MRRRGGMYPNYYRGLPGRELLDEEYVFYPNKSKSEVQFRSQWAVLTFLQFHPEGGGEKRRQFSLLTANMFSLEQEEISSREFSVAVNTWCCPGQDENIDTGLEGCGTMQFGGELVMKVCPCPRRLETRDQFLLIKGGREVTWQTWSLKPHLQWSRTYQDMSHDKYAIVPSEGYVLD